MDLTMVELARKLRPELATYFAHLDEFYEESTFTPTYNGATPGTTTYTRQIGVYTRIGRMVVAVGRVTWTATTGTGVAVLGGLPFTSLNTTNQRYPVTIWISDVTFAGSFLTGLLAENATAFTLYTTSSNVASTQINVEAAGDIAYQVTYFV